MPKLNSFDLVELESVPFGWLVAFTLAIALFAILRPTMVRDYDNLPLQYNPTARVIVVIFYVMIYTALSVALYTSGQTVAQFLEPLPYVKSLADQVTVGAPVVAFIALGALWQVPFIKEIDRAFLIALHRHRNQKKIFVNYRRDDDASAAARLRDRLDTQFGRSNIFMDVDNLLAGQRFDHELAKALADCNVFVSVIGPHWLELLKAKVASGQRDFVREEIAEALKRKIVVVPVRVGRDGHMLFLPEPDELPADIRELLLYQKQDVAHESFGRDVDVLVQAIRSVLKSMEPKRRLWRPILAGATGVIAIVWIGSHLAGMPVPWPSSTVTGTVSPR